MPKAIQLNNADKGNSDKKLLPFFSYHGKTFYPYQIVGSVAAGHYCKASAFQKL